MDILERIKNFLEKLQNLPEGKKIIILWSIVVLCAAVMGYFWVKSAGRNFSEASRQVQNLEIPDFGISELPQEFTDQILESVSPSDQNIIK